MKSRASRIYSLWRFRAKYVYLNLPTWIRRLIPLVMRESPSEHRKEYIVPLPEGFGPKRAVVCLSIPRMPEGREYSFSEHVATSGGHAGGIVMACTTGGFAVSRDLGKNWRGVNLWRFANVGFRNSRMLPNGEILLLATDPDDEGKPSGSNTLFVITDMKGKIRHSEKRRGAGWHGSRGIDISGETIMYAEYTPNRARTKENSAPHAPSRVWRSRDFGRSWEKVREESNVRHFHLLQAHPDKPGEWWLAAGDDADESRIWKSTDDGDTWVDQTSKFGSAVAVGEETFSRRLFRLTDLAFAGDEIIWGCDDVLRLQFFDSGGHPANSEPGSRVFRGNPSAGAMLENLGCCGPEVRSLVEVGEFYFVITQSSHHFPGNDQPKAFLLRRHSRPGLQNLYHLFDVDHSKAEGTGFTYSRASRIAKDGVFFTFRNRTDVFKALNHILRWDVTFE